MAGTRAGGMQGRGRGGARRREGFQGEEVVFGSNGRTRSVTRRVYPRECERRDARAREFARSPARPLALSPRLLFYVRALSIVVDVMRCARAQAAAADDRCGRCCRWTLPCVVGGGRCGPPFRTLPPPLCYHQRLLPGSLSAAPVLLATDSGTGRRGRRNDNNNNKHSSDGIDNAIRCRRGHRIVAAHAELAHSLSVPRPAAYPTPIHETYYVLVTRGRVPTNGGMAPHGPLVITATRCY